MEGLSRKVGEGVATPLGHCVRALQGMGITGSPGELPECKEGVLLPEEKRKQQAPRLLPGKTAPSSTITCPPLGMRQRPRPGHGE